MPHRFRCVLRVCFFLLFSGAVWADEAADRASIERVIHALNEVPVARELFTADSSSEFDRLPKVSARPFGPSPTPPLPRSGPRVIISREPWGEATIDFHGWAEAPQMVVLNPRISTNVIR